LLVFFCDGSLSKYLYYSLDARDEQENVIYGAMELRREIEEQLEVNEAARYFMYNEEAVYTKRESELVQQYIAEYDEMPEGNRDLDDLF
jgi:formate dehydrogenase beta subunit